MGIKQNNKDKTVPVAKKYRTVLADPPWDVLQRGNNGAINHYGLMSVERIKAMPVQDLVEDDAHCWLWVTNAALRYGYEVLEAWGFTPRSVFTWIKPRFNLGVYLRNATEHVLLGTKGKAPVRFNAQPTWGYFPLQEHSHKPEEQYAIIERVSHGPYLELFARRKQPGWDAWGDEIESDVELPGYPVPRYSKKLNTRSAEFASESEAK
jgi:N6-adenosine-specific RNA methylase IME4